MYVFEPILGMHLPQPLRSRGLIEPGAIDLVCAGQWESDCAASSDFHLGERLRDLQGRYDLVIVDTCALDATGRGRLDPVIVAQHTDTAVLVASRRAVEQERLDDIRLKLRRFGIKPLGVVFNNGLKS